MANPNNPLAPGLNGAAPKGPRTIWNNPVFSAVLAIIMGFAMWIIVTVYIDPQGSTTVTGVPDQLHERRVYLHGPGSGHCGKARH